MNQGWPCPLRLREEASGDLPGVQRRRVLEAPAGFTLVEMLVVITIISIVMSLVGPRVLNYLTDSKIKAAKIQIESFESALDLYRLDAGSASNDTSRRSCAH